MSRLSDPKACLDRGRRLNKLIDDNHAEPLALAGMICDLEDELAKLAEQKKLFLLVSRSLQDDDWKPVHEHLLEMINHDHP